MASKPESLLRRKQQVVRDAIWNAAMDLFSQKGFDEATVEEIAAAAGVSPRTFFRYFAAKSDLMGQSMLAYGELLKAAIQSSPVSANPFAILHAAVLEIAVKVASFPRARDVIAVSIRCPAAREAQLSRMPEVEEIVAEAFAAHIKKGREVDLTARLLAALTLTILDLTMRLWFGNETSSIISVAERVMKNLCRITADSQVKQ